MNRSARGSFVLIILVVILVAGFAGLWLWRHRVADASPLQTSQEKPATQSAAAATSPMPAAVQTATPDPPRPTLPGDRLPAAAVVSGNSDEQAAQLARQILAGGGAAFPALVSALQHAGFPLREADGTVVMPPDGRSQGIAFDAWEINALGGMVQNRTTISAPLSSFAENLASPLAELRDSPMADLLLDGVRRHARDADGPLLFWAMFIVELGRQAKAYPPYDLLGPIDPAKTPLDALQMVLISKRLAADAAAHAHPEKVKQANAFTLPSWVVAPAYAAAGPCTFTDAEGEIVDWTAFGTSSGFAQLFEFLESKGVVLGEFLKNFANFGNIVLTYAKLILTQLAFDIQFDMRPQPPLIRTTAIRPQSGESKTLTATVKLDFGKIEWLNCFRMGLNSVGMDFNLDASGPLKEASVAWNGISGFNSAAIYYGGTEQLVQFANTPDSRIQNGGPVTAHNAVLDQLTDAQGQASVTVEGAGQPRSLGSQPRPVMKEATASAMVVLKPADIYRDLKDATMTMSGGVGGLLTAPAELLYRTRWTFGGRYTFPVQDLKAGHGWTGTVSYTRIEHKDSESQAASVCCGGRPTQSSSTMASEDTVTQFWEIPDSSDSAMLTPGFSMATAGYTLNAQHSKVETSHQTGWASCRGGNRPQTSTGYSRTESGQGELVDTAQVTVRLEEDGTFLIAGGGPNREATGEMTVTENNDRNDGCNGAQPTRTRNMTGAYRPRGASANIHGKMDPNSDTLKGEQTRVERFPAAHTTITHVYQWDLRR